MNHYELRINPVLCLSKTITQNDLDIDEVASLKAELWAHQSRIVRAVTDFEATTSFRIHIDGMVNNYAMNRLKISLPAGAGKTIVGTAIVAAMPVVPMKPIYFLDPENPTIAQERIFTAASLIKVTLIVVRSSTYTQWLDEIERFSTLRVFGVSNLATLKDLVSKVINSPVIFNSSYDCIVVSNVTTSGNSDAITSGASAVFKAETKAKSIYVLMMNAFSRKCFSRIIYDDAEFHIKTAPLENALSCIYMSATHEYTSSGKNKISVTTKGPIADQIAHDIEFDSYDFSRALFSTMPTIGVTPEFLDESLYMARGFGLSAGVDMKLSISAMPAEPEIWLMRINTGESKKIDIIDALCNDAKIMESVNNLERQSFGAIIKSLMAERFVPYKKSMGIIAHYEAMDIDALALLPSPPLGASFQVSDIMQCEPINYSYRDIVDRVRAAVESARGVVAQELKVLNRIRTHLGDGDCAICMDSLSTSPAAIMICCNNIVHYVCALNCRAGVCAFCRAPYTREGTFVSMHHETDVSAFMTAATAKEQLALVNGPEPSRPAEMTKLSILNDILSGRPMPINPTRVGLRKHGALLFDASIDAKVESDHNKMKALVYCSAGGTLRAIERDIEVDHARLTRSSASTATKVRNFSRAAGPTALLADTWKDAAGINFRMATDIIVFNYVDSRAVIEQMFGRGLRAGREGRLRIWLLAFNNECTKWLESFMKQVGQSPAH